MIARPDLIADSFHDAVAEGLLLEKTIYYKVQRECISAIGLADPTGKAVLQEASRLARLLAQELESDAIDSRYLLLWRRYAAELEKAVRLAGSAATEEQTLSLLKVCSDTIGDPTGAPD